MSGCGGRIRTCDIQGYEPSGFGELVEPMLVYSGHQVRIVD